MRRWFHAYVITCHVNGRRYVGITSRGVAARWASHLHDSRKAKKSLLITRAIAKYGAESFDVEEVCCATSWADICALETALIQQHGTRVPNGYNVSLGGAGPFGVKRTAEQVEISASKHRGLPCHPNTREAAIRTHRGVPKTAEHRAKIAAAHVGKSRSDETKAKISAAWAAKRAAGNFKTDRPYAHAASDKHARAREVDLFSDWE